MAGAETIALRARLDRGDFRLEVDLALPAGQTTVVFGPSGCGKSSLLRVAAGLEPAAIGEVRVGSSVWQDARTFLPPHQRQVGMVFQQAALLPHRSVHDNLRYGWRRAGAAPATLEAWIERLALAELLPRRPDTLSGGERQRVALAQALVCEPRWLLLDEPLSALDLGRRAEVMPYLEEVKREAGLPILYVTHSVDEAVRLADHLVLMDSGRSTASGPALAVLNQPDLPLTLRDDAGVVLPATVESVDSYGLVELATPAGTLYAQEGVGVTEAAQQAALYGVAAAVEGAEAAAQQAALYGEAGALEGTEVAAQQAALYGVAETVEGTEVAAQQTALYGVAGAVEGVEVAAQQAALYRRARGAGLARGTRLRVRIQARDVSLALSRHEDSSLLNILPARIADLEHLPGGQVQVRLDLQGAHLLARISHRSAQRLALAPGQPVWAQIKAVALLL